MTVMTMVKVKPFYKPRPSRPNRAMETLVSDDAGLIEALDSAAEGDAADEEFDWREHITGYEKSGANYKFSCRYCSKALSGSKTRFSLPCV